EKVSQKEIIERLNRAGYARDNVVDMKGQFSVRGEIIDIFAINQSLPARIIMLGSVIEKIRYFDVESQRGFKDTDDYDVIPVNEFIIDEHLKSVTIENIKMVASENGLPAKKIKEYIDELDASFEFNLREYYLPFMYNFECASLMDYIPELKNRKELILFCTDEERIISGINEFYENIRANYNELLDTEKIVPPFDSYVVNKDEILSLISKSIKVERYYAEPDTEVLITKLRLYLKKSTDITLAEIKNELEKIVSGYRKCVFLYNDSEQKKNFEDLLNLMNIGFSGDIKDTLNITVLKGTITSVFSVGDILFFPLHIIIKEKKIFEYEESVSDKVRMLRLKFSEIKTGDYIVHKDFGIGIYRGLKKMSSEGGMQDYIIIEYKDKRLLYLPALCIDLISKYESGEGKSPS
ncbi:MAG: hypothetical protein N3B13_11890, partial [Deltaproteobacteria bacterium]|nr:hypothetical protein [Deltaproteobacteria bacterium]